MISSVFDLDLGCSKDPSQLILKFLNMKVHAFFFQELALKCWIEEIEFTNMKFHAIFSKSHP